MQESTFTVKTDSFTFTSPEQDYTSGQIASHVIDAANFDVTYTYTYDDNGNILSISDGTNTTSYVYDSANQLVRENNQAGDFTHTWTYDDAGNILNRKEYAYTTGALGTVIDTIGYTYGDGNWGDLLVSYNNTPFTYEKTAAGNTIGNLLSDGTWTYTWQHGRQLASMSDGTTELAFTYNKGDIRTQKINGNLVYDYIYNGGSLSQMTISEKIGDTPTVTDTLYFGYDSAGQPISVNHNGTTYYYVTNIQGNVIGILNGSGVQVVSYVYDAWGNLLSTTGTMATTLGVDNPLRYRGYVYDNESQLYYLQSRYYNPKIGRFVNADSMLNTSLGFLGVNVFSYCINNPIRLRDNTGNKPGDLFTNEEDAVRDAAIYIGSLSFANGWEYSTAIYTVSVVEYVPKKVIEYYFRGDGISTKTISTIWIPQVVIQYTYTTILTDKDPYSVRIPRAPEGHTRVGVIHTHPMGSNKGITQFSDTDRLNAETIYKCPVYVYGPNGMLLKYDNITGKEFPLFDDLPLSEKQPWLELG